MHGAQRKLDTLSHIQRQTPIPNPCPTPHPSSSVITWKGLKPISSFHLPSFQLGTSSYLAYNISWFFSYFQAVYPALQHETAHQDPPHWAAGRREARRTTASAHLVQGGVPLGTRAGAQSHPLRNYAAFFTPQKSAAFISLKKIREFISLTKFLGIYLSKNPRFFFTAAFILVFVCPSTKSSLAT